MNYAEPVMGTDNEKQTVTTGFGAWLARQSHWTEAGKLAAVLREELEAGRLAEWPRNVREVREAASRVRPVPPRAVLWLSASVAAWKVWLRQVASQDLDADRSGPVLNAQGNPADNPFAGAWSK